MWGLGCLCKEKHLVSSSAVLRAKPSRMERGPLFVVSCAERETMNANKSHEVVLFSHAINCISHAFVTLAPRELDASIFPYLEQI